MQPQQCGYSPIASIRTDPDCYDLCKLRCEGERCVADRSCDGDAGCSTSAPSCSQGQCVQCAGDDDCGGGKSCDECFCHARCKRNEECNAFYECNEDSGEIAVPTSA